jgi:hypothetical protein
MNNICMACGGEINEFYSIAYQGSIASPCKQCGTLHFEDEAINLLKRQPEFIRGWVILQRDGKKGRETAILDGGVLVFKRCA